jgi:AraC-like DNA-binding protein
MGSDREFHLPHFGRERLSAHEDIRRHRHWGGYITVVLGGGYQEAGFEGRLNLTPGDVIVHGCFDAHLDHIGPGGAELVNLRLPPGLSLPANFRIDDPDELARIAESDPIEAAHSLRPIGDVATHSDWPDLLAGALQAAGNQSLGYWARNMGLAAETLSRGFRAAYGITPARFRAEVRARRAMEMLVEGDASLTSIAFDCGYSDQPHLNRAIVSLTGESPGSLRKSNSFKKGEHPPV